VTDLLKLLKHLVFLAAAFTLGSALVLAFGLPSANAQTRGWSQGESTSTPVVADLIPKMSSDEAYTERYGFAVDLDNGGHIGVDWTISNLGWGDARGAASVRVRLPGHTFAGQNKYILQQKADEGEWTYSDKMFDIDIANTRVRARGTDTFVVTHKGEGLSFRLLFKRTTPMFKPGSGRIEVEDGYYKFNLLAARADVTGEVTIDGKTTKVKGTKQGYADHVGTNVAPFDLSKRFTRFRTYNNDVFVMWREITLHPDYGGRSYTWVVVGYKDQIVFSDPDAQLRLARLRKDPKTGYEFPLALQIDGKSGDDSIKLVMTGKKYKRDDLLANFGAAAKMVASTVSKPFRYTIKCDYTLQMTIQGATAQVSGNSHFVMDFINK
jgi:predicted secreted hydrolase